MEKIEKNLTEILVCPHCHSGLKILNDKFFCLNRSCRKNFFIKNGIPLMLPTDFENSENFDFKKAQINFFDNWSSEERGKAFGQTDFDKFFSGKVGEKKINYSEENIKTLLKSLPPKSLVLELGCGAGEHTAFIASQRKDIHLVAIDLSLRSVLETRKRIEKDKRIKSRVSFLVADAEKLPFREKIFQGVIIIMFFHHTAGIIKTLKEMKRTLSEKGSGLIVDLIADNPFMVLPRKIFPHLPYRLRKKFEQDYLLEDGEIPKVILHHSGEIKEEVHKLQLRVTKEERYDLFLFLISAMGHTLPFLKYILKEKFLNFLYNQEKKALRSRILKRFAGASAIWVSH